MPTHALRNAAKFLPQSITKTLALGWLGLLSGYVYLSVAINPLWFGWEMVWWTVLLFPIFPALQNARTTRALVVTAKGCTPFHAGSPGDFEAELHNPSPEPVGELTLSCGPTLAFAEVDACQRITLGIDLSHLPRGQHKPEPLTLSSSFPFGLFRSTRLIPLDTVCIVYPSLEDAAPPWPETALHSATVARSGEEVVALRDYAVGDPISTVDWKLSAKRDQLVVREFEPCVKQSFVFSMEQVQDLPLEQGLSRLATWITRAEAHHMAYALDVGEHFIPRGCGPIHCHACLSCLAQIRPAA